MAKTTYCCPVLELVVKRESRHGIRWGVMVDISSGRARHQLVLEFPKAKDRKEPYASTTYAPLNYCPFCGKAIAGEKQSKAKKAVPA